MIISLDELSEASGRRESAARDPFWLVNQRYERLMLLSPHGAYFLLKINILRLREPESITIRNTRSRPSTSLHEAAAKPMQGATSAVQSTKKIFPRKVDKLGRPTVENGLHHEHPKMIGLIQCRLGRHREFLSGADHVEENRPLVRQRRLNGALQFLRLF